MSFILLLALLLSTSTSINAIAIHINVIGSTAENATSFGSLQYYLCANGSTAVTHHSILYLSSSSNHTILPGHSVSLLISLISPSPVMALTTLLTLSVTMQLHLLRDWALSI